MRALRTVAWQGLVMEFPRSDWIEAEIELIFPTELKARLAQDVVAILGAWMSLRQVGCVRRDFVSNYAILHVPLVWKAEVFLWRHIAKHCAPVPPDHGCA